MKQTKWVEFGKVKQLAEFINTKLESKEWSDVHQVCSLGPKTEYLIIFSIEEEKEEK